MADIHRIIPDIHYRQNVLGWIQKKIEKEINSIDKELFFKFHDYMMARGLALATRVSGLSHLYSISKKAQKPLAQMGEEDINSLISFIENNGYTPHTKEKFRRTIKQFFSWMGMRNQVSHIKTMSRAHLYSLCIPETILTNKEIKKIILSGKNSFERALLSFMAETGARAGEVLNLRTRSIHFDKIGATVILPKEGKTGPRPVRLIRCKCNHPNLAVNLLKKIVSGNEFVFSKYNHLHHQVERISYHYLRHMFNRLNSLNITIKKIHPHLFRHTRATQLSAFLSHTQLCDYFGWQYDSKMPPIYIRANNVSLDNALLRGYRMKEVKPKTICVWCL